MWFLANGWHVITLEWRDRWNKSHDVAGCDVLASRPGRALQFVQATDMGHRELGKLCSDPDAREVRLAGAKVLAHCWRYLKRAKRWAAQVHSLELAPDGTFFMLKQEDIYE